MRYVYSLRLSYGLKYAAWVRLPASQMLEEDQWGAWVYGTYALPKYSLAMALKIQGLSLRNKKRTYFLRLYAQAFNPRVLPAALTLDTHERIMA